MDYIPVMVSERLIDVEGDYIGKCIGQFRSFNRHEGEEEQAVLSVFGRVVEELQSDYDEDAANQIFLDGYICKEAIYRKNTAWTRNCRPACGSEPFIWQVRLYSMYLLGKKCHILCLPLRWVHMCRYGVESREKTM